MKAQPRVEKTNYRFENLLIIPLENQMLYISIVP